MRDREEIIKKALEFEWKQNAIKELTEARDEIGALRAMNTKGMQELSNRIKELEKANIDLTDRMACQEEKLYKLLRVKEAAQRAKECIKLLEGYIDKAEERRARKTELLERHINDLATFDKV